jgi:signal transduction histidine kinase
MSSSSSPTPCGDPADFIAELISASFRGTGEVEAAPTGRARKFLSKILEHFHAEGIVFWRLEGPEYAGKVDPSHRLVSGVSVFKDREGMPERLEIRDLPIMDSSSGIAFAENREVFGREGGPAASPYPLPCEFHGNPCFIRREIKWLLALPVAAPETGVFGVLSLYWRDDQQERATGSSRDFFRIATALWPGVYQRIRESRRLQLIMAVDGILGQPRGNGSAVGGSSLAPIEQTTADNILNEICGEIGRLLHAEEVSIFLTPLASDVPKWSCRASNWKPKPTRVFTPDALRGITGWCLKQQEPIYIPDLHSFGNDKSWLQAVFGGDLSGQSWEDDLGLERLDEQNAKDAQRVERPVRSFLAAPLVVEGDMLGVIRCTSKANSPLIYFSNADRTSLEIVGTRIAQTWRNWQIAHAKNEEAQAWQRFNNASRKFPEVLAEAIRKPIPDLSQLEDTILKACQESLSPWGRCQLGEPAIPPLGDQPPSGNTIAFEEAYPGATMVSPASGILEMAERQLEAYRRVCSLVNDVQKSTRALSRALSDLRHQIINPLNKALLRANRHLRNYGNYKHVGDAVYPIRGLLRKSVNVANAFNLLVDLEKTDRLSIKSSPLDLRRLYVLLTEVVRDARLDLDRNRELQIVLNETFRTAPDPDSGSDVWYPPNRADIRIDFKLLEQVLNSVIENAVKYSNAKNTVLVDVQVSDSGLNIDVSNRGARLLPHEVPLVTERNYRSPTAERYVAEGTGIGLYLVKAIANAHGAAFWMVPTNEQGFTHAVLNIPTDNQTYESHSS